MIDFCNFHLRIYLFYSFSVFLTFSLWRIKRTKWKQENILDKCDSSPSGGYTDTIQGLIFAFGTVVVSVISATCVQLLEREIPDFELNAMRCCTAAIACLCVILCTRKWPIIPQPEIVPTLCLAATSFITSTGLYISASIVPLLLVQAVHVFMIGTSGIIFFHFCFEEKLNFKKIASTILVLSGTCLVLQPEFIFQQAYMGNDRHQNEGNFTHRGHFTTNITIENKGYGDITTTSLILGITLSGVSGITVSASTLILKRNQFLQTSISRNLFWDFVLSTLVSLIIMWIFEKPRLPKDWLQFWFVAGHCLTYIFLWPSVIYSSRYISGTTMNIVFSTAVVFMLIPQYTVLSSILPGHKNWIEVVGAVLVFLGSSLGSGAEFCQ